MKRLSLVMVILACTSLLLSDMAQAQDQTEPLLCYVGGTMRPAVEKLAEVYKAKTGEQLHLDFGDSGELFIKAEQARKGDVLIVHDPYLGAAVNKGLADQGYLVAGLTGVIVVPKGNPKGVHGIADLAKPGMRLILTDAEYSTLGHIVTVIGKKSGLSEKLDANCVTRTRSGGEAANAVALGTADAGIVWNAVAFLRKDKLDAVPIEQGFQPVAGVDTVTSATFGPMDMAKVRVTAMTLTCSKQLEKARAFAAFLASPEAAATWKDLGYTPMEGGLIPKNATKASAQ
jgi:molybdate transport system substrate-binding protein